ncbi:hypothetical protein GNF10_23005 [Nostoc sp. UCD121]|uniref:hypothetical protein n=1 Tax=unclassified Nostoc TaxID=2593658 RepID=UPI001626A0B2|nr:MULTISPECIES: hypothetical protein [unclassified Nostoc]MBC1223078.1 hypothetical protein [Nostoc sp. UCD120]MBC1278755.1 hypothetical protein [Nostoc sp. UCD121]MBC1295579.1 hypothetical protein [Nostoc sp. UCD122]
MICVLNASGRISIVSRRIGIVSRRISIVSQRIGIVRRRIGIVSRRIGIALQGIKYLGINKFKVCSKDFSPDNPCSER